MHADYVPNIHGPIIGLAKYLWDMPETPPLDDEQQIGIAVNSKRGTFIDAMSKKAKTKLAKT